MYSMKLHPLFSDGPVKHPDVTLSIRKVVAPSIESQSLFAPPAIHLGPFRAGSRWQLAVLPCLPAPEARWMRLTARRIPGRTRSRAAVKGGLRAVQEIGAGMGQGKDGMMPLLRRGSVVTGEDKCSAQPRCSHLFCWRPAWSV